MTQEANLLPCSQTGLRHYLASLGKRWENPALDGLGAGLGGAGHRGSRLKVLRDLTGGTILQTEEKEGSPSPCDNNGGVTEWPAAGSPSLVLSCPALDFVPDDKDDKVDKPGEFLEKKNKNQGSSDVQVKSILWRVVLTLGCGALRTNTLTHQWQIWGSQESSGPVATRPQGGCHLPVFLLCGLSGKAYLKWSRSKQPEREHQLSLRMFACRVL